MTQEEKDQVTLHIEAITEIYKKERETNPTGRACCLLLTDNDEKQSLNMAGVGLDIALLIAGFFDDDENFKTAIEASIELYKLSNHEKA
ncbi:MAG: hypothetical protein PHI42_06315 [Paludibacteraceae bacterium]|nr:hypothetical protein [Paludibacteraceae bacterium]